MDDIVAQAMARWPDVPAVYGWLRLDGRGRWLVKGEPISHRATLAFINRNYLRDERGRYYFQNGPQRVFVDLDQCPYILSLDANAAEGPHPSTSGSSARLLTHCGDAITAATRAWIDPQQGVAIEFERGVGSVLDRDLPALIENFRHADGRALDTDDWNRVLAGTGIALMLELSCGSIPVSALPARLPTPPFDFDRSPSPDTGEDACT